MNTAEVKFKCSPEFKAEVAKAAKDSERDLSKFIRFAVNQELKKATAN